MNADASSSHTEFAHTYTEDQGNPCIRLQGRGWSADLHPQGQVWSGPTSGGDNVWLDENTLAGGMDWTDGTHLKTQIRRA